MTLEPTKPASETGEEEDWVGGENDRLIKAESNVASLRSATLYPRPMAIADGSPEKVVNKPPTNSFRSVPSGHRGRLSYVQTSYGLTCLR